MADNTVEMQVVRTKDGGSLVRAFEWEENLKVAGTSKYVLIPDDLGGVTVTVSFTGGASGYVEATTDRFEKVQVDVAQWVIWDLGEVSETSQDACIPPTALRAVQVGAGTMKMTVRAQ